MLGTAFQQEILKRLSELGTLYIVGGAVRDDYLGIPCKDVDVVTSLPLREIEEKLFAWGYTPHAIGAHQQTVSLFKETERLDIAPLLGEVEKDAQRRDFTINAIFQDVQTGKILDPLGGLHDLRERRLKACDCAEDRFAEDPLRILRLVRLAVCYGFWISQETWQAAVKGISGLHKVAAERVTQELARILVLEDVDKALDILDELGYWQEYVPELARLKGLVQNRYHTKDAWEHTRQVVKNTPDRVLLRLAALLHDIGKWETASRECYIRGVLRFKHGSYQIEGFKIVSRKSIDQWIDKYVEVHGGLLDNFADSIVFKRIKSAQANSKERLEIVPRGKRQFLQHEKASVRLLREILPRFRWSMVLSGANKGQRDLEFLIEHHMLGISVFKDELRILKETSKQTRLINRAHRFAWEIGWNGKVYNRQRVEDLLELWRADFLGGKQVEDKTLEHFTVIQEQIRKSCLILSERHKLLNWADFTKFSHNKGLSGENFGLFKEQVRRRVMLDTTISLSDLNFLEREYIIFAKGILGARQFQ